VELIWDGEQDAGGRAEGLVAALQSNPHPDGVLVALNGSHVLVEIPTQSSWAFATWTVAAIMIGFGFESNSWFLLMLAPFMVGAAMMQSMGKVAILIRDEQVTVFEGVGGIGRRRAVPLRAIQRVEYAVKRGRGGATAWIVVNDMKFGRHLNDEQIQFVIALLLDARRSLTA
jgi:hypothetical protein